MEPMTSGEVRATVREVSSIWWIVLVVGILFAGFGVVMLFNVAAGARVISIIVGAFLIFDGVVGLITAGQYGGSKALGVLLGIVLIIGGIVVAVWPGVTFLVIAVVWGITIVVGGITRIVGSIAVRGRGWGWVLVIGIAELIVGIAALVWPDVTAYVILLLIGIYAIVAGLIQVFLAFELKRAPERLGIN
ncbi:MAG: HdeD family acid-resistance protein [Acidimicrobiia bacterium]